MHVYFYLSLSHGWRRHSGAWDRFYAGTLQGLIEVLGRSVSYSISQLSESLKCDNANCIVRCDLGGDAPGHHASSHQEHAPNIQMF